ncbi:dihydrofolate reductase family protein [Actinoplanes sp. NPDC051494]|uniref:dihydrofolate reductase family protein n=1 Tax=Actinoplanes sp. NPDC051494 TaxID=3363907 RepID=UPI0037A39BF2
MGDLICTGITSLDGYIADENGAFDWSVPDEEVHRAVNDLEKGIGTYLYGRGMYEVMSAWETMHTEPGLPPYILDYASVWQAADKVVYSTTLPRARTARTRVERSFDPAAVRAIKENGRVSVGGPGLAAQALRAGLVDEIGMFVSPVVVGGGKRFLPDGVKLSLELREQRRFGNGVVYLRYRVSH